MNNKSIIQKVHVFCTLYGKIPTAMRMTLVFLFVLVFQIQAEQSYSQTTKISLDMKNSSIEKILQTIEERSEYYFLYNSKLIDVDQKMDIQAKEESIASVLNWLFDAESVEYEVKGSQIILHPKEINQISEELTIELQQQQKKTITGTVIDIEGVPVIGVNIIEVGTTSNGTITDSNGEFSLQVEDNSTIHISYIGYLEQDISTSGRTTFDIVLLEDTRTLEEIVVIGYGVAKKSDLTGSVASVSGEELIKRNPINMEQGLQGLAPGVQVIRTSGSPDGGVTVRIRGTATINNSADPLYVVDGIMVGTSASFLNPNDIESIEILKDASATAIYGSRGANGVVMITTKKGEKGSVALTFSANTGIQTLSKKLDVTNAEEFATAFNKTAQNDGTVPNPVWADPSQLNNIDWQDEMTRNSIMQNYNFSASGGSDKTQAMMSVGYLNNEGIIIESNFQRLTARANINHEVKDFIRTGLNLSYTHSEREGGGNLLNYATLIPTMDTLSVDGSGNLVHVPIQYQDGTWGHFPREGNGYNNKGRDNPVAAAKTRDSKNYFNRAVAGAYVEIDLLKGLMFRSVAGVNYNSGSYYNYAMKHNRTYLGNNTDDFTVNQWQNTEFLLENYFTYDETFHQKHHLTLLAGHSVLRYKPQDIEASSSIFPASSIRRIELTSDPLTLNASGGLGRESRQQSFFGRIMYSFKERYLLTATIRRDGSSNFGKGNKYGNFPSASIAWRAIEEDFIRDLDFFSNLKLRLGWGQTGNAGNSTNLSVNQLSSDRIAYYFYNPATGSFAVAPGLAQIREIDTNLKWETNEQTNIGLDVGVLNNSLTLTLDYFQRDAKDLLLFRTLRPSTGYSDIYTNSGHIRNTGFEFQVGYQKKIGDLFLSVKANGTTIKNKAIEVGDDIYSSLNVSDGANWGSYSITRNGYPVGSFFGWRVDGIFQDQAEIDALNAQAVAKGVESGKYQNAVPGDYRYKDLNGDGTIDDQDREILGDGYPTLTYGLNVSLNWRNWDFNMYLYGVAGQDILSYAFRNLVNIGIPSDGYQAILKEYAQNAWDGKGSTNTYARLTRQDPNHNSQVSDIFIMSGDFLKLQNIQVGYTFTKDLIRPLRLESVRLFASVDNLFTITSYKAGDPEIGESNVLQTGFDRGRYPFPRTYTLGLSFGF